MPRLIKKYANRRLYDTVDSRHVTLEDLRRMIVGGTNVRVVDDTSGDDITRSLLLQIIVDRERAGEPLLSEVLLAQLIRFYGNPMQGMMADYLQRSVDAFLEQQRSLQSALSTTPLDTMRELMRGNAATWEALMRLVPGPGGAVTAERSSPDPRRADVSTGSGADVSAGRADVSADPDPDRSSR